MKKTAIILFALPLFFLPACKQTPKGDQQSETQTVQNDGQTQVDESQKEFTIEESGKTLNVEIADQYAWQQQGHVIQVVNIDNESEALLKKYILQRPVRQSLYLYCFKGNAPVFDPALKGDDTVQGAIAVKAFIKGKGPVATLYRHVNGPDVVYKKGFAE